MKASLSNYHQSPQKVRLVADMIRGKSVSQARAALSFMPKKSSPAVLKLLNSAVANARSTDASVEELFVKTITVNKGSVLKRFAPRARGRAARFSRTMSHIVLELGTKVQSQKAKAKKTTQKPASDKPKTAARKRVKTLATTE